MRRPHTSRITRKTHWLRWAGCPLCWRKASFSGESGRRTDSSPALLTAEGKAGLRARKYRRRRQDQDSASAKNSADRLRKKRETRRQWKENWEEWEVADKIKGTKEFQQKNEHHPRVKASYFVDEERGWDEKLKKGFQEEAVAFLLHRRPQWHQQKSLETRTEERRKRRRESIERRMPEF